MPYNRIACGTETLKGHDGSWRLNVTLNGETRQLDAALSVRGLLASLGLDPAKIAVERNLEIVPRSTYDQVAVGRWRPAGDRAFHRRRQCAGRSATRGQAVHRSRARPIKSRLIIGTGKYKTYADNAAALEAQRGGDRHRGGAPGESHRSQPAQAGGFHRSEESDLSAQHRRLLHRRGCGAHLAAGARGRRLDAGQAGSAGRQEDCFIPT